MTRFHIRDWQSRTTTFAALALGAQVSASTAALSEMIDEPAQFAVLGVGLTPCTSFIRAVDKPAQFTQVDRQVMLSWVQGYLSLYNSVTEGTYDVTGGTGTHVLENSLLEFCRRNPRASLINAVDDLLTKAAKSPLLLKPATN